MNLQILGLENQKPFHNVLFAPRVVPIKGGGLLGNDEIQQGLATPAVLGSHTGLSKLERLKRARFTPQGKAARVARALSALEKPGLFALPREVWKRIAEDKDIEEQP